MSGFFKALMIAACALLLLPTQASALFGQMDEPTSHMRPFADFWVRCSSQPEQQGRGGRGRNDEECFPGPSQYPASVIALKNIPSPV